MRVRTAIGVCIFLLVAGSSHAHDHWLEPETFFPDEGRAIAIRLIMGDALKAEGERPLVKSRIERFMHFHRESKRDLLQEGADDQIPAARVAFSRGDHLIAMERKAGTNRLDAVKFTEYLKEEGLDEIVAQREALGESKAEGRERYTRYLKTLVRCGEEADSTFRREVGHRLEIIPLSDPSAGKVGDPVSVRVVFEGKPSAKTRVYAEVRDQGGKIHAQSAETDSEGRASIERGRDGLWLIRVVRMWRAPKGGEVEWESDWASYTFGFRDPNGRKP